MVQYALVHGLGGEILVPKIPSYRITDVAEAIGPECEKPIVGIRPGEKLHEEMVTISDSQNTIENDRYFIIVPMLHGEDHQEAIDRFASHYQASAVPPDFRYSSDHNDRWLSKPSPARSATWAWINRVVSANSRDDEGHVDAQNRAGDQADE